VNSVSRLPLIALFLSACGAAVLLCLAPARAAEPSPDERAATPAKPAPSTQPFELKDGDRVVFVGGTFMEREAQLGYIETMLTMRFADRNVTFRNLGYAGDTVACEARRICQGWATFGGPDEGFNRLKRLIEEIQPTVVIACYGMGESFGGEAKLSEFVQKYNRLLDMLTTSGGQTAEKARVVLISPNYHEDLGRPLPDPSEHNKQLRLYSDATRQIAERRGYRYVDLFAAHERIAGGESKTRLTNDGVHLTNEGYARLTREIAAQLGLPEPRPSERTEAIRKLIVAKNADFFNYWRPENDTYILGYRKNEQGRNAVELPQFKPLVEEKEREIAKLKAAR
jgi:lysophospholipase L1-like esterase